MPWWEGDSFLWHPQPRVASLLRQQEILAGYGFSGSIGLHWRTRDIEANAWAFFESGWERRAGKEHEAIEMYRDHVASGWGIDDRCDQVSEIAGLLQAAEAEQWFRTASPEFFGYTPQWGQIEPAKKKKIQGLLDKLIEIGKGERGPSDGFNPGGEDLRHAISTLRFVLYLDTWSRCVAGAQEAYERGAHEEAWRLISQAPVLDALRAYMARVTTRGELGVLASINQRAWQFYRELYERIVAEVDPAAAPPGGVLPELPSEPPAVVLPVRSYWQPGDSHATWRVIAGSLDVAAVFLRVNDSTGASRRFKFSQTGPGAFRLRLQRDELSSFETCSPLDTVVEIVSLPGDVIVPVGGRAVITLGCSPTIAAPPGASTSIGRTSRGDRGAHRR